MIGFRGASRYYHPKYREVFALECEAIKRVRDVMGLRNVKVMIPFCRTLEEGQRVIAELEASGLRRGVDGLEVYVMCEIPNNVILAAQFAELFDGFSIGSNDLTQLTLGVDRDSSLLAPIFDEQDPGVKALIASVIETAHRCDRKVGLCGQAPSDRPEVAEWLADCGIDSISVTPDALPRVLRHLAGPAQAQQAVQAVREADVARPLLAGTHDAPREAMSAPAETNAAPRDTEFFLAMQASHRLLETLFEDLVRAAQSDDHAHLHAVWVQFEHRLLAHLEAEERYILPAFARTDTEEALALLREHGKIREQLLAIGIAVELHYARLTRVEELIAGLRAHAAREEKMLYRWASELLDPELASAASHHLETASV